MQQLLGEHASAALIEKARNKASAERVRVLAPGDALTQRPRVTLRDLDSRAWVLPPQGTGIRAYFDALWAGRERRPTLYPLATTALTVVLEAMRSQAVVSLMPRSFAQSLVDTGQAAIVPLKRDSQ